MVSQTKVKRPKNDKPRKNVDSYLEAILKRLEKIEDRLKRLEDDNIFRPFVPIGPAPLPAIPMPSFPPPGSPWSDPWSDPWIPYPRVPDVWCHDLPQTLCETPDVQN